MWDIQPSVPNSSLSLIDVTSRSATYDSNRGVFDTPRWVKGFVVRLLFHDTFRNKFAVYTCENIGRGGVSLWLQDLVLVPNSPLAHILA